MAESDVLSAPRVVMRSRRRRWFWAIVAALFAMSLFGGLAWQADWMSQAPNRSASSKPKASDAHGHAADHAHHEDGHDHSHEDDLTLVELSKQARGNIGLEVQKVDFSNFTRTITVPAIVVERPGRSQIEVVAPMGGVVTRIYVIPGQTVEPGQPLFDMRLTHEELVQAQSDFLRTLEELDVINKEIKRLEIVAKDGAIAGKVVLERQYERQKLEAVERAQEQALELHGLKTDQVASIRGNRKLLSNLTVSAPVLPPDQEPRQSPALQVEELNVEQGQNVAAGAALCQLSDHAELYVEGKAFQQDADLLNKAAQTGSTVCAVFETSNDEADKVCNLKILYLANRVDAETRLFPFFATLPNQMVRDDRGPGGRRFVGWRFRPGQRAQLKIPVETWSERIVLPVEAVVEEGPESYVFREDGDHFHRCPVHIEYRDQFSVVLAEGNDIWPGDRVAMNGAQQLYLALKNKSGGGIDPHAGHNH